MRAVILAGGRGARLAPYTTVIPKPLLPVGDTSILEIVLRQLAHSGITHATLTLGYLAEYFQAFLSHHNSLGQLMTIDTVVEEQPTGTAGSLAFVPDLKGDFLVMNGDILTDLDYQALIHHHQTQEAWLTIATHHKDVKIDLGVLELDSAGTLTNYIEKPVMKYAVSMGIYVYSERVLPYIVRGQYLDFPDLALKLVREGKKVAAFENQAAWLDLGRPDDLHAATETFLQQRERFLPP